MTTIRDFEGRGFSYTNDLLETSLLQLNAISNYYTTGEHNIIFIKIGSRKLLLLDHTYHTNRNTFQNYTINT